MKRIAIAVGLLALLSYSFTQSKSVAQQATGICLQADAPRPPIRVGHPTFASPHASPIAVNGGDVFVVNTPADTLDLIDAKTRKIRTRINVGVDPVSVAIRPDGKEVWVSNHVSDSVSVIDNVSDSSTYLQVVATIQQFAPKRRRPRLTNQSALHSPEMKKRTLRCRRKTRSPS